MRRLLLFALIGLAGCQPPDWRVQQIALAEAKMRTEVGDPKAEFSKVQVTGDQKTGQICGVVRTVRWPLTHFIVYIDGTAGPYVEAGQGRDYMTQDSFDSAWQNDCVAEGYAQ